MQKRAELAAIIKKAMSKGDIIKLAASTKPAKPITKKAAAILKQVKTAASITRMKAFLKSSSMKPKDLIRLSVKAAQAKVK